VISASYGLCRTDARDGKVSMLLICTTGKLHLQTNAHWRWTTLWSHAHWQNLLTRTFYTYILQHYGHPATRCGYESICEIMMQLQLSEQGSYRSAKTKFPDFPWLFQSLTQHFPWPISAQISVRKLHHKNTITCNTSTNYALQHILMHI